jgi:hypothetical protein
VAGWVAHGGAAMESWPARWRGVRRRGRCSRRWSSASAPAPRPELVHVLLSPARRGALLRFGSSCPRRPPAAAHRRRRVARPPPAPPPLLPLTPFLSSRRRTHGIGENPNAGWWDAVAIPGLSIESWSRRCRGKDGRGRSYWWPWRGGRRGATPVVAERLWRHRARAKGSNPPGGFPWTGSRAHATPRRAGQLTPGHPIPRAGRWAARCGRVGG